MGHKQTENLPVWLYWEGDLPDWINECQNTVFAHASNVYLLTPESFNALRDVDLDISIEDLYVAHRADFIRAFLLAKYGGLWIDSDCLVLKSLQPVLDILEHYAFIGYRERSGEVTNNFMGACEYSIIAANYYKRVCDILRAGETIEWLTLGSKALTATLDESLTTWYELKVELVQPICWSNPGAFLHKREDGAHNEVFNTESYCYMLSSNMIGGYLRDNDYPNLLDQQTFFSFLLRASKTNTEPHLATV